MLTFTNNGSAIPIIHIYDSNIDSTVQTTITSPIDLIRLDQSSCICSIVCKDMYAYIDKVLPDFHGSGVGGSGFIIN